MKLHLSSKPEEFSGIGRFISFVGLINVWTKEIFDKLNSREIRTRNYFFPDFESS